MVILPYSHPTNPCTYTYLHSFYSNRYCIAYVQVIRKNTTKLTNWGVNTWKDWKVHHT